MNDSICLIILMQINSRVSSSIAKCVSTWSASLHVFSLFLMHLCTLFLNAIANILFVLSSLHNSGFEKPHMARVSQHSRLLPCKPNSRLSHVHYNKRIVFKIKRMMMWCDVVVMKANCRSLGCCFCLYIL